MRAVKLAKDPGENPHFPEGIDLIKSKVNICELLMTVTVFPSWPIVLKNSVFGIDEIFQRL